MTISLKSFDIEHFLSLPCHVYWKDKKNIYQGYNDYGAKRLGFNQGKDITGHSDFEIFPGEIAAEFKKNDEKVITQREQIYVHENGILKDGLNIIFLSYKMPLFDHDESVVGILGLSFTRAPKKQCPSYQLEQDFNYQSPTENNIKPLSKMEEISMRLLCRGLTIKQIAHRLKLSPRTVESYVDRVKIKYNCRNKAELMWKLVNTFSPE